VPGEFVDPLERQGYTCILLNFKLGGDGWFTRFKTKPVEKREPFFLPVPKVRRFYYAQAHICGLKSDSKVKGD